jgi:hypothetical protein
MVALLAVSWDTSEVHLTLALLVGGRSSVLSANTTGLNGIPRALNTAVRFSSVVVPESTQMLASARSLMLVMPGRLGDHQPLAVVERGEQEGGALLAVTSRRPGRVADQHVDLARLERGEPGIGSQRHELDGVGIAEHGGRHHPAEVDVEAAVVAGIVDDSEPGEHVVDAASHGAAVEHRVEQASRIIVPVGTGARYEREAYEQDDQSSSSGISFPPSLGGGADARPRRHSIARRRRRDKRDRDHGAVHEG